MTAPYSAQAADAVAGALEHHARVMVRPRAGGGFGLDLEHLAVTFDEAWAPYAQVSLEAALPTDQAHLDALDPRILCRLDVEAGYTYQDGTTEIFPLVDVGLVTRDVKRPANTMSLTAESDESRLQDRLWVSGDPIVPSTGINEAVTWCLDLGFGVGAYTLVTSFAAGSFAADLADLEIGFGESVWSMLAEIASRTGQRIYCDEDRVWRIAFRPVEAATPAHYLRVGENGTLTDTSTSLTKADWYNAVFLRYEWETAEGNPVAVYGYARVTSGPFAVGVVGHKYYTKTSRRRIQPATADKAAAAKLRNLITRGRSLTLTAVAAYWLRPGMTVSAMLPTGTLEKYFIQRVTFHPLTGLMDIVTRQPLDVEITTGE